LKISHFKEVPAQKIKVPGVKGVTKRVLIGEKDGAPNVTMRIFHVEPEGYTYHHAHDFEHEIFIIEGTGQAISENGIKEISQGNAIFIAPNEIHQIRNSGNSTLTFLCVVPNENEQ
jgi:quercetin dioxygenase-like cupin family protein